MPVSPEMKEILEEKGIVGVSDPPEKIRIYVEKEKDLLKLPSEISIQGVSKPIEGIVIGRVEIQPNTGKYRPAPGGVSIGHKDISAGTLGCVVWDKQTMQRVILSNNHVLAHSNLAGIGDEILQPGPYDGGSLGDKIALLSRFIEIKKPPETNLVDAAIAVPINDNLVSDEILRIGEVKGIAGAREGLSVKKTGRTTDFTTGTISDIHATIKVHGYPFGYALFEDQIIATRMSAPGDSGSAVLSMDDKIVGLLFAGSKITTVINKIQNVFSLLDLDLMKPVPPPPPPPPPPPKLAIPLMIGLTATPIIQRLLRGSRFKEDQLF